ncbi:GntR family transcriptional regulator [Pusillimonas caeni]|uniref:GntR family transcriptional regulator n=1 Tax=Pusillimonas caeni TaxID=1348472 RepID=UPI000E59A77A|nr:GntR family transcriptional regulator [Pusillimonas caeni]TFL15650.1 GntR family transcriptional regulator [Pusillimonas caeni]
MATSSKPAKTSGRNIIQAPRLGDQVYALLKEDLIAGEFEPGQRVVERDLSQRYNVSRTPIREAMTRLSQEGLLDINERGYAVPVDAQRNVFDRLEVRQILEVQIVRRAAQLAEPKALTQLQKHYERELAAHESDQHRKFIDAHHRFKETLRDISGNQLLNRCAAIVDDTFQLARDRLLESADNRRLTVACDGEVLEALRQHDAEAAVAAVERFIASLQDYFRG